MPCPTCDHTMQGFSVNSPHHWCPRCGTVKTEYPNGDAEVSTPTLPGRVAEHLKELDSHGSGLWWADNVDVATLRESVTRPGA